MDLSWISVLAPWLLTRETALLLVGGFVVGIFSVIIGGGFFISIPLLQFLFPSVSYGAIVGNLKVGSFFRGIGSTITEPEGDRLAQDPPFVCAARHWHGARCHGHRALAPALDAPGHHRGYRAFRARSLASEARDEGLLPGRVARDRRLCWVPRRRHRHHFGRPLPSQASSGRENRAREDTGPLYRVAHLHRRRHSALLPREPHPRLVACLVGGELRGRARGRRSLGEAGRDVGEDAEERAPSCVSRRDRRSPAAVPELGKG